jgi:hypothetical protein
MTFRLACLSALIAAAALSACVIAPPNSVSINNADEVGKMSEKATATCGAGMVKEVNAKSFTCK